MHRPPAVAWDVGALRWPWRLLSALAVGALLLWLDFSMHQQRPLVSAALLALLLACVAVAAMGLRRQPLGQLQWDGSHWHWSEWSEHPLTDLVCVLDWQSVMLLRLQAEGGARRWLWLEARRPSAQWLALRRAVVVAQSAPNSADSTPEA